MTAVEVCTRRRRRRPAHRGHARTRARSGCSANRPARHSPSCSASGESSSSTARRRAITDGQLVLDHGEPSPGRQDDRAPAGSRGRGSPAFPTTLTASSPSTAHGRVSATRGVFAAGDATSFPIKQGGLATQQADVAAETHRRRPRRPPLGRSVPARCCAACCSPGGAPRYLRPRRAGGDGELARSASSRCGGRRRRSRAGTCRPTCSRAGGSDLLDRARYAPHLEVEIAAPDRIRERLKSAPDSLSRSAPRGRSSHPLRRRVTHRTGLRARSHPRVRARRAGRRPSAALWGLAAGLMSLASVVGLLVPALDAGSEPARSRAAWRRACCSCCSPPGARRARRPRRGTPRGRVRRPCSCSASCSSTACPEGFAIGSAFASEHAGLGVFVLLAIALQKSRRATTSPSRCETPGSPPRSSSGPRSRPARRSPWARSSRSRSSSSRRVLPVSFAFAAARCSRSCSSSCCLRPSRAATWRSALVGFAAGAALMLALRSPSWASDGHHRRSGAPYFPADSCGRVPI